MEKLLHSFSKKIIAAIFAFTVIAFGVCCYEVDASQVKAASSTENVAYVTLEYTADDVNACVGVKAPTPTNNTYAEWLFAGWFKSEDCTLQTAVKTTVKDDETIYYAKFVPADVLGVKCQISADTTQESETTNMRFVSSVDSLVYKQIGFKLEHKDANGKTTDTETHSSKTVFSKIVSNTQGDEYEFSPKVIDTKSEYFITANYKGITDLNQAYYVRAYWKTLDGVPVYGAGRYVTAAEGLSTATTINVPVKMTEEQVKSEFTVSAGSDLNALQSYTNTSVAYYDGTYAHLRIPVAKADLKSATKVEVKIGEEIVATAVYRNLYTEYNGTADESWYLVYQNVYPNDNEFVVVTNADLYGLASINTSHREEIIYLVHDIVVNENAPETLDGWKSYANPILWTPIGKKTAFNGTFDAQGHMISGIYAVQDEAGQGNGLFSMTGTSSEIKNLKLKNSYFTGENYVGSIAGKAAGKFENIYSNAIVDSNKGDDWGRESGGIAGITNGDNTSFSKCWFDGTVDGDQYLGGIVGVAKKNNVSLADCLFTGVINCDTEPDTFRIGGLIGQAGSSGGTLADCVSVGTITVAYGAKDNSEWIGSVIGLYQIDISSCTDTYASTSTWAYSMGEQTNDELANLEEVEHSSLTGITAQETASGLDWTGTWITVIDGTPVLRNFATETDKICADASWYKEGDTTIGVEGNPYIIKDVADLYGFAELSQSNSFAGVHFKLGANIVVNSGNAADWKNEAPEKVWTPIGNGSYPFKGVFDGAEYTISGLYATGDEIGLFGMTTKDCVIKNLKLANSSFSGEYWIGSIAGRGSGKFEKIYIQSDVSLVAEASSTSTDDGRECGGLVGMVNGVTSIEECWFAGNIMTETYSGGLVGNVNKNELTINNSLFSGSIESDSATKSLRIGGLVGNMGTYTVNIQDSLSAGDISILDDGEHNHYGSVVGYMTANQGTLTCTDVYTITDDFTQPLHGYEAYDGITERTKSELYGYGGYLNAQGLEFDDTLKDGAWDGAWVARSEKLVALRSFVDSAEILDLSQLP